MSSDNGPEAIAQETSLAVGRDSNGPFRGVKRENWEGGVRVPFTVRWPARIAPGTVSTHAVSQVDILATIAEITGYKLSGDEAQDSESFLAVLEGVQMPAEQRASFITHSVDGQFALVDVTGQWKYIDGTASAGNRVTSWDADDQVIRNVRGTIRSNPGQLFNLAEDPGERHNLLLVPDNAALHRTTDMRAILNGIRGDTTFGSEGGSNVPNQD